MQRWFADSVARARRRRAGAIAPGASWSQKTTFGWGVGGNVLLPVWPKFVDLQGSVLYGQGIGRYGSSQLADVVIGPNGSLQPITSVQFMVGAVVHPFAGNDIYAYYGQEQTQANAWTVGGVQGGWGNQRFPDACGLLVPGSTDSVGFNGSSALCAANVQRVQEFTVGFWQDIYKGDLGRARVGLQYEYVSSICSPARPVLSLGLRGDDGRCYGWCQHRSASEQQHRLLLAPLLSLQLSGTGQKLRKAPPAQPAALCARR